MFFIDNENVTLRWICCDAHLVADTFRTAHVMPLLLILLHEYSPIKNRKQCWSFKKQPIYKSYWWIYGRYSLKLCDV